MAHTGGLVPACDLSTKVGQQVLGNKGCGGQSGTHGYLIRLFLQTWPGIDCTWTLPVCL